jgi:hypothetical protein
MDRQHKQVVTTYPLAIKSGQGRIHVPNPIPWHPDGGTLKCPDCETIFILTAGFPAAKLLTVLRDNHANRREHDDYVPSEETWTKVADCDCGRSHGARP